MTSEITWEGETAEEALVKLRDYERRSDLLDDHLEDLLQRHPFEWVAIPEDDSFHFDTSFTVLLDRLRVKGYATQDTVMLYLNPNPRVRVL